MTFSEAGIPLSARPALSRPVPVAPKVARKPAARRPAEPEGPEVSWPVDPIFVTSPFGWRVHPITGQGQPHSGIDLGAVKGQAVHAALDGVVLSAERRGPLGLCVELRHDGGLITRYGHLMDATVGAGDVVWAGNRIGHVGATGRTTGPHLHFEVREAHGYPVDPLDLFRAVGSAGD